MGETLSYSLADLIAYPPEAYWSLFERANALAWPVALVLSMLTGIAWALSVDGREGAGRLAGVVLGFAWVTVAMIFVLGRYEAINWAAIYLMPVFLAQAILVGGLGAAGWLSVEPGGRAGLVASFLVLAAVLVWPILAAVFGRTLETAQVFAISPDATAVATLGFVSVADRRWVRLLLAAIPMLWLALSATTLLTLELAQGWVLVVAMVLATLALSWRKRRPGAGIDVGGVEVPV
ncbi:MAG: DUF6064 family protein [Paracoccaceae bacterium]